MKVYQRWNRTRWALPQTDIKRTHTSSLKASWFFSFSFRSMVFLSSSSSLEAPILPSCTRRSSISLSSSVRSGETNTRGGKTVHDPWNSLTSPPLRYATSAETCDRSLLMSSYVLLLLRVERGQLSLQIHTLPFCPQKLCSHVVHLQNDSRIPHAHVLNENTSFGQSCICENSKLVFWNWE